MKPKGTALITYSSQPSSQSLYLMSVIRHYHPLFSTLCLRTASVAWCRLPKRVISIHPSAVIKEKTKHIFLSKYTWILKGIVQLKMKLLLSFTHTHVVPKLHDIVFFCETQKKIFWSMMVTKQFWFPLTSIKWTNTMQCKSMGTETHWLSTYFKTSFCVCVCILHKKRKFYRFGMTWGRGNVDRM